MTNKTSSFLAGFALLTALFSTGSYVNIIDDDDDDETEATSTQLHITTRGSSANDTLSYPITLYAFNAASKLQASATLNSSTDNSVLALSNGSYRLVARPERRNAPCPQVTSPRQAAPARTTCER